jgi:hypothetical protein
MKNISLLDLTVLYVFVGNTRMLERPITKLWNLKFKRTKDVH